MPQGSILGPILFNIVLSDLCLIIKDTDFASYTDGNSVYKAFINKDNFTAYLQQSTEKLFKWFSDNQMKGSTDKCHLIISSDDSSEIKISNSLIKRSNCQKLLRVKINTKSLFDDHIKDLRKKANSKLGALVRVTPNTGLAKKKKKIANEYLF